MWFARAAEAPAMTDAVATTSRIANRMAIRAACSADGTRSRSSSTPVNTPALVASRNDCNEFAEVVAAPCERELVVGLLDHDRVVRGADDRGAGLAREA